MPRHAARPRALAAAASAGAVLLLTAGNAQAEIPQPELQQITDRYLFQTTLHDFTGIRADKPYGDQLDWSSDSCSYSPNEPLGYDFGTSCDRHDFGYRNYEKQSRFTDENRLRIDDNFKADMRSGCGADPVCKSAAEVYYWAVRQFGDVSVADAMQKAQVTPKRSKSGAIIGYQARDAGGQPVHFNP